LALDPANPGYTKATTWAYKIQDSDIITTLQTGNVTYPAKKIATVTMNY
jgi:hypothetical protein